MSNEAREVPGSEIADLAIATLMSTGLPPPGDAPLPAQAPQQPVPPAVQPAAQPVAPTAGTPPTGLPPEVKSKLSGRYSGEPQEPIFKQAAEPLPVHPPEATPPEGQALPEGAPPAAHAFAQLRSENARFKREVIPGLEAARKAAEDAKAAAEARAAAILADKEALANEKTSLLEQLGRVSLTESPAFKEKYGGKELAITQKLSTALQKFAGMTPEQASEFASQVRQSTGDAAGLAKATESLHPAVAGAAILAAQEYAAVEEERSLEVANWRQSAMASGVQESREAVVRSAEERKRLADLGIEFAKRQGNPVFGSQDPEEAGEVADVIDAFHGFVQSATEEQLVQAASEGFTAPFLYQRIASLESEKAELLGQLQGFRHAMGVPVGIPRAAPAAAPKPALTPVNENESVEEMARRFAAETVSGFQLPRQ